MTVDMRRVACLLALALLAATTLQAQAATPPAFQHDLTFAAQQLGAVASTLGSTTYPYTTTASGAWATTGASSWTSGFFPGSLWLLYQHTGDSQWLAWAQKWQAGIESQKNRTDTHDLGFMFFTSFGNGYRLTGNDAYRQVLLSAAGSLAQRYSPAVGCIKSWDAGADDFKVIIDNMINLELLFWAAKHGGDPAWYAMALSHALKTREQHVRADGSTYHLVNYDPVTGAVKSKQTVQGYSDGSTWSRGQAWAVYGFTIAYRETADTRFLETARATADYFIDHLPADQVPYWDFQAPGIPNEPRDSSAAAVAASGLLELSQLDPDRAHREHYRDTAERMLIALSSPAYLAEGTPSQAVLLHGTRNKPGGSFDTGLVWGDYYFLEALLRYSSGAAGTATLAGRVIDRASRAGIAGATITYAGGTATTDATGGYRIEGIASGVQTVDISAPGYLAEQHTLQIAAGATTTATFELAAQPATIAGTVSNAETGQPIRFATVSYAGGAATTNALGQYRFEQVRPGTYSLNVSAVGYLGAKRQLAVHPGEDITLNFLLAADPDPPPLIPRVWVALAIADAKTD
jgi:unsaturated chondroitin disaccharide hydrolase